MLQKLKDWLIVLLGGLSKNEYKAQQTILKSIYEDLLKYDDRHHIELIAKELVIVLRKIKNNEHPFENYNNNCDNPILEICRSFEILLLKRINRGLNKLLNIKEATFYRDAFLQENNSLELPNRRKKSMQYEKGNNEK